MVALHEMLWPMGCNVTVLMYSDDKHHIFTATQAGQQNKLHDHTTTGTRCTSSGQTHSSRRSRSCNNNQHNSNSCYAPLVHHCQQEQCGNKTSCCSWDRSRTLYNPTGKTPWLKESMALKAREPRVNTNLTELKQPLYGDYRYMVVSGWSFA